MKESNVAVTVFFIVVSLRSIKNYHQMRAIRHQVAACTSCKALNSKWRLVPYSPTNDGYPILNNSSDLRVTKRLSEIEC